MQQAPEKLFAALDALGIPHRTVKHPPLYTVEQSRALRGQIPGGHTKNLFLRDKKNALYLVVTLEDADIVIKSPGVSLYHPLIKRLNKKGVPVTSLLNLWLAEPRAAKIICVTGTKGKSTTSSLLAHVLKTLGKNVAIGGNIGVPVSEIANDVGYAVVEVSSFQAANIEGASGLMTRGSDRPSAGLAGTSQLASNSKS